MPNVEARLGPSGADILRADEVQAGVFPGQCGNAVNSYKYQNIT